MRASSRHSDGASSGREQFLLDALRLDRKAALPLHHQVYRQMRDLISERVLPAHSPLPSTRAMANDLAVSRNTVLAAYEQLESEGYIETRPGARARVTRLMRTERAGIAPRDHAPLPGLSRRGDLMVSQPRVGSFPGNASFHPGTPDLSAFPFKIWRRLVANELGPGCEDVFGYHHIAGLPRLRTAIASYLAASRGVCCDAEQIVVTTGGQAALDLLARLLIDPGDRVWMEEPGYLGAQSAFLAADGVLLPLPVGPRGWDIDSFQPKLPPRLIYVTPSCQSPLGLTMRVEQRQRLIELADQWAAWVIEDDFDSEYRFSGAPIPAMQGTDRRARVLYVGTFAKTVFPSLRIGFAVLPPALSARVKQAINFTGQFAPLALQAALATFIEQGHLARHLRRMRRVYARRRQAFLLNATALLGEHLTLAPCDAGTQMTWLLRNGLSDIAVATQARRHGLNLAPLSSHYRHGGGRAGFVLGYVALDEAAMRAKLLQLRLVLDGARADATDVAPDNLMRESSFNGNREA